MQEDLKKIMNHFGMERQVCKLAEECREFLDSGEDEEIADVYNLAKNIHDHSPVVRRLAEQKRRRTLYRIKIGYEGYEGVS